MHFTYSYISHEVEKFQKYSDFLFFKVWSVAKGRFDSSKLREFQELKSIYERLHNDDTKGAEFFNKSIELIYNEFLLLNKNDRTKLRKWYLINNDISGLCHSNNTSPISYKKLKTAYPKLGNLLEEFYKKLYGKHSPFNLAAFNNLSDLMASHYEDFIKINNEEICPYCAINSIKGIYHSKREAYDHFIPKGKYPFNSINFKNLAPMCHECNSSYKLEQEPLMYIDPLKKRNVKNKARIKRKAFYSFGQKKWKLDLNIELLSYDFDQLNGADIVFNFCSIDEFSHKEQILGWREIYGIDERYKAKILGKRGAKKWFNGINDEIRNLRLMLGVKDVAVQTLCDMKIKEAEADPYDNANFIKKAFLEECKRNRKFK